GLSSCILNNHPQSTAARFVQHFLLRYPEISFGNRYMAGSRGAERLMVLKKQTSGWRPRILWPNKAPAPTRMGATKKCLPFCTTPQKYGYVI
ncbi:MAG: hypothetical protein ACYC67_23995, partial [Prosthecobacter sp.]